MADGGGGVGGGLARAYRLRCRWVGGKPVQANQFSKCPRTLVFVLRIKGKNRGKYHQTFPLFSLSFTLHKLHSDSLCTLPKLATIANT